MMKRLIMCTAIIAAIATLGAKDEARPAYGAVLRLPSVGTEFQPRLYVAKGCGRQILVPAGGDRVEKDGSRHFFLRTGNGAKSDVDGRYTLNAAGDGVEVHWGLQPQVNATVSASEVRGVLPLETYSGGSFVADGQCVAIPTSEPKGNLWEGRLRCFDLSDKHGKLRLTLEFLAEQAFTVQMSGDPKIGGKLILCIGISDAMAPEKTYELTMKARTPDGLRVGADVNYRIDSGENWVPFISEKTIVPGSALDLSGIRTTGMPAGCYGRVVAVGDHFEFEGRPGEDARFYGVNVCTGALMPDDPEHAKLLAKRLAASGYNAVRIHHQDTWIVTAREKGDTFRRDGVTLNPRQVRKFDAFVAACVENGLYLTTDLFCSRTWAIRWRDVGIDRDGLIGMGDFKSLVQVHEGVYSNYLAFARNFLGHKNVFTGRSLAEEPALGWISLVNEGCLGRSTAALEKWPEWRAAWIRWLDARRREDAKGYGDIPETFPADVMAASRHACAFKLFLADTESAFARKVRRFLREEMGCKALWTNMNGVFHTVHTREARVRNYDYIDGHFYVDHPNYLGQQWRMPSSAGTRNPITNACGANYPSLDRDYARPFTITEWNYCAPNPYRGCAGLLVGAAAAVQGWGGLWHFDFAGGEDQYAEPETAAMGPFAMVGDPLMRASDRTALFLYLRGDMKSAEKSFVVELPERTFRTVTDELPNEDTWHWLNWVTWYGRLGSSIVKDGGKVPSGLIRIAGYPDDYRKKNYAKVFRMVTGVETDATPAKTMPVAADGQVRVDGRSGTFCVNTPRTCGGFVSEGSFTTGVLHADVGAVATSVAASSLDEKPISRSDRILVTHLVDCVNKGIVFTDESRNILSEWGKTPQLVRKARAEVSLAVCEGKWLVWAIDMDGSRVKPVPCVWRNGRLAFVCDTATDPRQATFHYELVRVELPIWKRALNWLF